MHLHKYSIYHRLTYHFVWSPMRYKACLCGEAAERLAKLIEEKIEELGVELVEYRIMPDKVYVAVVAPPNMSPHRIACQLKAYTSHRMREEFVEMTRIPTLWTRSYLVIGGEDYTAEYAVSEFEALQPARRPRGRPRRAQ